MTQSLKDQYIERQISRTLRQIDTNAQKCSAKLKIKIMISNKPPIAYLTLYIISTFRIPTLTTLSTTVVKCRIQIPQWSLYVKSCTFHFNNIIILWKFDAIISKTPERRKKKKKSRVTCIVSGTRCQNYPPNKQTKSWLRNPTS